jgi:hypothetical protein
LTVFPRGSQERHRFGLFDWGIPQQELERHVHVSGTLQE